MFGFALVKIKRTTAISEEAEEFYTTLHNVVSSFTSKDIFFIMGDFNSKLGMKEEYDRFMGAHGRGFRNSNGHILGFRG